MPAGSRFLIEDGMLSDKIGIVKFNGDSFYSIELKNQLLHAAHPLGWFCEINLAVDGVSIPREEVYFELRGQWICTAQIYTITDIFWYIMEKASLNFRTKTALAKGLHSIDCEFVASMLEVATQLDLKKKWPRRRQTVTQASYL